ncbi:MAG: hypothetical protein ABTA23_11515, partial [Solibacillus sp.]
RLGYNRCACPGDEDDGGNLIAAYDKGCNGLVNRRFSPTQSALLHPAFFYILHFLYMVSFD